MDEFPAQDMARPPRSGSLAGVPVRTMALNLALIAVIFITRDRWKTSWAEAYSIPEPAKFVDLSQVFRDGERAVIYCADHTLLWDVVQGKPLASFQRGSGCKAVSPRGGRIVIGFPGWSPRVSTPLVVDADSGGHLLSLEGHHAFIHDAAFSPDGDRIVTASSDGTARTWDARTGVALTVLEGHEGDVYVASYSPEGARILTGDRDGTARPWDARTGRALLTLPGHGGAVLTARFLCGGRRIGTYCFKADTFRLWDAQTGDVLRVVEDTWAFWGPGGKRVVTAKRGGGVAAVWDAETAERLATLPGHMGEVYSLRFSRDGKRIVTVDLTPVVRLWDAATGSLSLAVSLQPGFVESAALTPDGTRMLTWPGRDAVDEDASARVWDAASGQALAAIPGADRCCVLGDGLLLVSDGRDRARVLRRVRPEWWWGVFWLPHFWVIVVFAVALVLSGWYDLRKLKRPPAA